MNLINGRTLKSLRHCSFGVSFSEYHRLSVLCNSAFSLLKDFQEVQYYLKQGRASPPGHSEDSQWVPQNMLEDGPFASQYLTHVFIRN